MNLLETLTHIADEEQLRLRPLPEHVAAAQAEHLRRHYALLLAAVLTAQPVVSEPQIRLLRLLLDALKLGDIRGQLFEQARELTSKVLLEAARLIRDVGFARHLVLDILVLLRLDAPLGDDVVRLVGELAAFLNLDDTELTACAKDGVDILGLNVSDGEGNHANVRKKKMTMAWKTSPSPPRLLAEFWPGRLTQPLTAGALRAGLQGGLWLLDANLDVDFPWRAQGAILIFRNGARLNTFAKKGMIQLADCRLGDAMLDFQGECSIILERCDWRGDYDPEAQCTALNSQGEALTIIDCQFFTRNARTIAVDSSNLILTGSRFTHCGHVEIDGGAVWHSSTSIWPFRYQSKFENCRFDYCLAARGGAIFVREPYDISKCNFLACESQTLQENQAGNAAIYVY